MTDYKIPFSQTAWTDMGPEVRQKRGVIDKTQLRVVEFDHAFVEKDWCIKGHIGYVISGEMHIDFEDSILKFELGDAFYIPHGQRHKMSVVSEKLTLFLSEEAH